MPIVLRDLDPSDLAEANSVIAAAIQTWDMAPRVKRLALASHQYQAHDFQHLAFVGAFEGDTLLGLIAMEPGAPSAATGARPLMLIHGLYVIPDRHGTGIGSRLVDMAASMSRDQRFAGLMVRAEKRAKTFFRARGFTPLPIEDEQRDYPHRLLLALDEPYLTASPASQGPSPLHATDRSSGQRARRHGASTD
jgi:GNAT superfamily N-acetyltransferase